MGATLTLERRDGNLLIAFTAVFVGIVTERFWRIACMSVVFPLSDPLRGLGQVLEYGSIRLYPNFSYRNANMAH